MIAKMYKNSESVVEFLKKTGDSKKRCGVEGHIHGIETKHSSLFFFLTDYNVPTKRIGVLTSYFPNVLKENTNSLKAKSLLQTMKEQKISVFVKGLYYPLDNIIDPNEIICRDDYLIAFYKKSSTSIHYNPAYVKELIAPFGSD